MNKNFYNLLNRPATIASCAGSKIYEWDYLDETGKVKHAKENTYEKIQSYKDSVDYKKLIERGELEYDDNGIYMDTTKLGNNFADLNEYVHDVAEHVQQLKEQQNNSVNEGTTSTTTETKVVSEVRPQGNEIKREGGFVDESNGNNGNGGVAE